MIVGRGSNLIAIPATDVVAITEAHVADSSRCFDIDALLGLTVDEAATQRAVEIAVSGGTLIALSRADLTLSETDTTSCYSVPRILRDAGCAHLRAFVVQSATSGARVIPWVDMRHLLETEYTQRLFFSPDGVAPEQP
jgi:hypothetical protein